MLECISFLCGAGVMVLEMAGARVLAPYLGTSIVVWTALIGVILGSLSLGYWLGGKAGDRSPSAGGLAVIILLAALLVLLAAFVHDPLLKVLAAAGFALEIAAVLGAVLLFAAPCLFLGMASPYIIQVKLQRIKAAHSDKHNNSAIIGRFFAVSTIGSIVGTFLGGYVLIAWLGVRTILYAVAGTLAFAAFLAAPKRKLPPALTLLLCLGLGIRAGDGAQDMPVSLDTRYNHIRIQEGRPYPGEGTMRFLSTDPGSMQSGMFLDKPEALALQYTKHYAVAWHMRPEARRFLMLGGGGYSVPKYLLATRPEALVDVVEIDPGVTEAARRYFNLRDNPRLRVFHEDGRVFLNREVLGEQTGKYHIIMEDAFSSNYNIPFHLATVEAAGHIYALLDEDGVFACNIISSVNGDQGRIFRAIRASFAQVFPQTHVFLVNAPRRGGEVQNIMLLALKKPRPIPLSWDAQIRAMLDTEWTQPIPDDVPAFTDAYAPVERYAISVMRALGRL